MKDRNESGGTSLYLGTANCASSDAEPPRSALSTCTKAPAVGADTPQIRVAYLRRRMAALRRRFGYRHCPVSAASCPTAVIGRRRERRNQTRVFKALRATFRANAWA